MPDIIIPPPRDTSRPIRFIKGKHVGKRGYDLGLIKIMHRVWIEDVGVVNMYPWSFRPSRPHDTTAIPFPEENFQDPAAFDAELELAIDLLARQIDRLNVDVGTILNVVGRRVRENRGTR